MLLHNGNQHPSIPVGHAVHTKETYKNLKHLLNKLEYSKYGWHICGDLKVVSLLMGLQLGYTKYCCFLCEWDSRAKTFYYLKRDWPQRKSLKVRAKNVQHPTPAEWHKILLPPLHIKLDLMKNFVKAMDRAGSAFKYLAEKFPQLSEAKIKEEGLWVLRSASSSETICSTTYFRVTRKKLGTRFIRCQLTFSGISGQKNYVAYSEINVQWASVGSPVKMVTWHCGTVPSDKQLPRLTRRRRPLRLVLIVL